MPKKILLADDSITIQKVVELTFSDGDYEVSAVNNGAKAIQKLSEMRPDIILSDIIMPEKNGYEVCEYVKSHPEYRNIPVILLTGTFEPFDPDRAEKAGCDAVVTKPFESQSLIHKVEELITQAKSAINATAAVPLPTIPAPEPEPAASPWIEDVPLPPAAPAEASPFTTSGGSFPLPPMDSFTHGPDIFSAPAAPEATTEMPFDTPAESPFGTAPPVDELSGETRAFPKMNFEEMQQMAAPLEPPAVEPEPPPALEPSPWDEPAEPAASPFAPEPLYGAETRAFTKMSIEEMQQMASPAPVAPEPESDSPFGEPPPAEEFSGETRAFPKLSYDELQQMAAPPAALPALEPPRAEAEASPWDEAPETPGGEPDSSPWGEPETAAFGGETRAFPKMSFEDLQKQMSTPGPEPEPEPMAWDETEPTQVEVTEEEPVARATPEEDMPFGAAEEAELEEPALPAPAVVSEASPAPNTRGDETTGELTEDQIDRIARRVVELMSDQVVRNIAWEVIPDLAEMVVKERIRQLESEG
jgi:CheY-like chemotaxis protein